MIWSLLLLAGASLVLGCCFVYGRGAKYGYRQGRKHADAEWSLWAEHGAL